MADDEFIEGAKATQETAKTIGKAIDAGSELGKFISKVFGDGPADFVGLVGMDWLHVKRQERFMVMADMAQKRLAVRGITDTVAVPLKVAVPLIEHASLEEDDDLSEVWANLLANAMDPVFQGSMRRTYTGMLANLEATDIRVLDFVGSQDWEVEDIQYVPIYILPEEGKPTGLTIQDICDATGLEKQQVRLSLVNLNKEGCISHEHTETMGSLDFNHSGLAIYHDDALFRPTLLGWELLKACSPEPINTTPNP